MRWIFYTLMLLNLVYLGWQLGAGEQDPEARVEKTQAGGPEQIDILTLLSEAEQPLEYIHKSDKDGQGIVMEDVASNHEVALPEVGSGQHCLIYGPFLEAYQKDEFMVLVAELGYAVTEQKRTPETDIRYWAYIDPLASPREAMLLMSKIRSTGMNAFLIAEGELANGLSLGVFDSEVAVEKLRQEPAVSGVLVRIEEKSDSYEYYEVSVRLDSTEISIAEMLSKVQERYPQINYRQKVCKSVASVE